MASSTHHCLSPGGKLWLVFWSPGPLVVILLFLIHHILEFWHCFFHHYSDRVRINKINYGSFLKLYSSSYVFLNCGCLSACQLCHKIICFSFRAQKRNMRLCICCLHKHRFTMRTLETINNILKNALRPVIYPQAIHSFI